MNNFFYLCFIIFSICTPFVNAQAVYTIGGDNPDFTTFTSAVQFLENTTLTEAVTFNVRAGIYEENIVIPEITGASESNPIIFQSEDRDATAVTIRSSAQSDIHGRLAAVALDGTDWLQCRYLTFEAPEFNHLSTVNYLVFITQHATNNTFADCVFRSTFTDSSNRNLILVGCVEISGATAPHVTNFINNQFINGYTGLYADSWRGTLKVVNNTFTDFFQNSFSASFCEQIVVTGNTFGDATVSCALNYLEGVVTIERNVFDGKISQHIPIRNTRDATTTIKNNYFRILPEQFTTSISMGYDSNLNIYHNTFNIESAQPAAVAYHLLFAENVDVQNNIIHRSTAGDLVKLSNLTNYTGRDNNYSAVSSAPISYDDLSYAVADFAQTSVGESNPLNVNPRFVTNSYSPNHPALDNTANPLNAVTVDLNNQPRAATPDIGALEFSVPINDAGITAVQTPTVPFVAGDQPLVATLTNYGTDDLTNVNIITEVNGQMQSNFAWTGSLSNGESTTVTLPDYNFQTTVAHNLAIWTELPNGQPEGITGNDTVRLDKVYSGLSGSYTVGDATADFITLSSMNEAIDRGGIVGATTMNILAGTYSETLTFAAIPGTSSTNILTVQSQAQDSTQVTLSAAMDVVTLVGTQHVTLQYLSFNAADDNMTLVSILNGASDNTVQACSFKGENGQFFGIRMGYDFRDPLPVERITVSDCKFSGEVAGITTARLFVDSIPFAGINNQILNNRIVNEEGSAGIYMDAQQAVTISGNYLSSRFGGIQLNGINSSIDNNVVFSNSVGFAGILLITDVEDFTGENNGHQVFNNYLQVGPELSSRYIVVIDETTKTSFMHNTVVTKQEPEDFDFGYALRSMTNNIDLTIKNNIFKTEGQSVFYFLNFREEIAQSLNIDNNTYFINSGNIARILPEGDGGYYQQLSDWQTTKQLDLNSQIIDPQLATDPPFQPNNQLLKTFADLDVAAQYPTDIAGNPRSATRPTVGAAELPQFAVDVAATAITNITTGITAGTQNLQLTAHNFGTTELTDFTINWSVNDVAQDEFNYNQTLAVGERVEIDFGTYDFALGEIYDLSVTFNPVNATDDNLGNNTITYTAIPIRLAGEYTIGGTAPDFADVQTAIETLAAVGVAAPVTFNVRPGTYELAYELLRFFGDNSDHPVTFKAENGQVESVVIHPIADRDNQVYGFTLRDVRYLTFERLTFSDPLENATNEYIKMYEQVSDIAFIGCHFLADVNVFGAVTFIQIREGRAATNLTFVDCLFKKGNKGITIGSGDYYRWLQGFTITNNQFVNQQIAALELESLDGCTITDNQFAGETSGFSHYAVELTNCQNFTFARNEILLSEESSIGLRLYDIERTELTNGVNLVFNNFIYARSTIGTGLEIRYTNDVQFKHNTVSGTAQYALLLDQTEANEFTGNIFSTQSNTAVISKSNDDSTFDYNNYFSNGTFLVTGSTEYADLAAWQTAEPESNQNSLTVAPFFQSPDSYEYQHPALDASIPFSNAVAEDITNAARAMPLTDMGCYEREVADYDISIIKIQTPTPPFSEGEQPFTAIIFNAGSEPITGIDLIIRLDEQVVRTVNFNDNLDSGVEAAVDLGMIEIQGFYDHTLQVQANLLANTDAIVTNNVQTVNELYPGLSGVYLVGAATDKLTDLQHAMKALQRGGLARATTLQIRPGTYQSPFIFQNIPGAGSEHPLIVEGLVEDGETVELIGTDDTQRCLNCQVLQIADISHVTFRNLIIRQRQSFTNPVIIDDSVSDILFENNQFLSQIGTTIQFANLSGTERIYGVVKNLTFRNNLFLDGHSGLRTAAGYQLENLVLENNIFAGQDVYLMDIEDVTNFTFNRNIIEYQNESFSEVRLITLQSYRGDINFNQNKIFNDFAYGSSIYLYNRMDDDRHGDNTEAGTTYYTNNLIYVKYKEYRFEPFGGVINDQLGGDIIIAHNTIVQEGDRNLTPGMRVYSITGNQIINNNIFKSTTQSYPLHLRDDYGTAISLSNNVYSTNGTTFVKYNHTDYTLTDWTTNFSLETNPLIADPAFDAVYFPTNTEIYDTGTEYNGVTVDIEGKVRSSTTPDPGVYEDSASNCPDGVENVCEQPLAVNKINFQAYLEKDQTVHLKWQLENSVEVDFYRIQRSVTGVKFQNIAQITRRGVNNFIDTKPLTGTNYYRLVIVKTDGTRSYSAIKQIDISYNNTVSIIPNPVTDRVELNWSVPLTSRSTVQLLDAIGKVYQKVTVEPHTQQLYFNLSELPAGVYHLQIAQAGQVTLKKLVKL